MIIAHFPAGYLLSRGLQGVGVDKAVGLGVLIGAVLPDLDMLRFWLIDGGAVHHHTYITHRPIFWVGIMLIGFVLGRRILTGIGIGAVLHVMLDSIVGAIAWAWPLSDAAHPLVVVPAVHDNWVLSFVLHWTFLVEIAVCVAAGIVWFQRRAEGRM